MGGRAKQLPVLINDRFGKSLAWGRPVVEKHFGVARADAIQKGMINAFEAMAPRIPLLRSPYAQTLLMSSVYAWPLYQAAKGKKAPAEVCSATAEHTFFCLDQDVYAHVPAFARWGMKNRVLNPVATKMILRVENILNDPRSWYYEILPTRPGHWLDYNIKRCGIHRLMERLGTPELTSKAICPYDEHMCKVHMPRGTRLSRTSLLSTGGKVCDFRYRIDK